MLQCSKVFLVGSQGRKTYNPEEFDEDIRHERQESTASAIQTEVRVISDQFKRPAEKPPRLDESESLSSSDETTRLLQCPKVFLVGSQGRKTYNPEEFDKDRTSDASPVFSVSLPFKKRKFNIPESTTSSTEDGNGEAMKQSTCDNQPAKESSATTECTEADNVTEPADLDSVFTSERYLYIMQH